MPHQFLLHAHRGAGVVQPRPVDVTEGMPANVVQFLPLGKGPALFVHNRRLAVCIHAALADLSSAVWTLNETPACRTKIILLRRRGMEVTAGDRTGEHQLRAIRTPLPLKKHRRKIRIERKLILRIFCLHALQAAVHDSTVHQHAERVEVNVLPGKRQYFPNPAINGVMSTFTGVSLFSAVMTPFTNDVEGFTAGWEI